MATRQVRSRGHASRGLGTDNIVALRQVAASSGRPAKSRDGALALFPNRSRAACAVRQDHEAMALQERPLLSDRCQKADVVARHLGKRLTEMSDSILDAASVTFEVDRFRANEHLKGSRLRVQKLRP